VEEFDMKVFISWSGDRSKEVARALRSWIPKVFQSVDVWMSEKDIGAGAMWLNEIMTGLKDARFGIVCVTPENQNAPWLHFEAGAIAKQADTNYVCPYLFLLNSSQLQRTPLTNFQYKQADEIGTKEIVESINPLIEKPLSQNDLHETFTMWWPRLAEQLNAIPEPDSEPEIERSPESMLDEVLGLVRQMSRSLSIRHGNESKVINRLLQTLSPKEERIISILYGLGDETVHTYEEVGEIFGIKHSEIIDVEVEAINKLKRRYPLFFKSLEDSMPF
jgi:hypothetical protein